MDTTNSEQGFASLGIDQKFLTILEKNKYTIPTPIQAQAIPVAIKGTDVIGIAQTGTGKTLAFGIPMLQRLSEQKGNNGLVVVPTRELALQVEESLHVIGKDLGLKTTVLIGGEPIGKQIRSLRLQPHIFIATPGRLNDHLKQGTVKLDKVRVVVLDEADRMLDMGFAPQIKEVFRKMPTNRQTMLFSATMPNEIVALATSYMQLPVRVEVAPAGSTAEKVTQEIIFVHPKEKPALLQQLLEETHQTILVFTRTKYGAKKVTHHINKLGSTAAEIHSNRSLSQRKEALAGFKSGKYRVLVATDIAARGIDVSGINLVVNYDLPEHAEDYVHRIGRTARAGKIGKAISFVTPDQKFDVRSIERVIKMPLPVKETPKNLQAVVLEGPERPERSSRPARSYGSRPTTRPSYSSTRSATSSSRSSGRPSGPRAHSAHSAQSSDRPARPTGPSAGTSRPSGPSSESGRPQRPTGPSASKSPFGNKSNRRNSRPDPSKIYWHTVPKDK